MTDIDIIEDVKILDDENDMYGAREKALSIVEFIELENNKNLLSRNNLIAIYGKWGTGKSSILKTVEQHLNTKNFDTLWFDTWKNEKDNNLPYSLFKFIIKDKFSTLIQDKGKSFVKGAYSIFKCLSSGINFNVNLPPTQYGSMEVEFNPKDVLENAENEIQKINENKELSKCLWEKISDFEKDFSKIGFGGKRLVVFLDDLDRCESENIIVLLSAIKLLLSCNPNIIFIIGVDKEAVALALQNKYNNNSNKANEYLEKLFPVNFTVSNKFSERKMSEYIRSITGLTISESQLVFEFLTKIQFKNPRHIKKVFRKYYIIKNNLCSRGIYTDNVYMVIFAIYLIVLNNFYENEYNCLVNKDKSKLYQNIVLEQTVSSGKNAYSSYNSAKKSMTVEIGKTEYEVFNLVEKLSPDNIVKYSMYVINYVDGPTVLPLSDWLLMFENNISTNFIEFVVSNGGMLDLFIDINAKNKVCSKAKIEEYINKVDGLM